MLPRSPKMPMSVPLEEEEREAEFYAEPFEAWRAWDLIEVDNQIVLRSITYKTFWPFLEEMVAQCNIETSIDAEKWVKHSSPDRDHHCGIYSVKEQEHALRWKDYGAILTPNRSPHPRVYGRVKIWGRILPYTHGYRSEKAYPSYILVPHTIAQESDMDPREIRRELEKNYRVKTRLA